MDERARRPRRWPRRLRRLAAVTAVLVLAAYLLRGPLFGGMLRSKVADALADAAGGTWTVADVEGSWITDITFRGVELTGAPEGGALEAARCERATVTFRPLDLIFDGATGVTAVRLEGLDVQLGAGAGSEEETDVLAALEAIPMALPAITIDGTVRVAVGEDVASAGVHIESDAGQTPIRIELADLRVPIAGAVVEEEAFAGVLHRDAVRELRWMSEDSIRGIHPADFVLHEAHTGVASVFGMFEAAGGEGFVRIQDGRPSGSVDGVDLARARELVAPWVDPSTTLPERGELTLSVFVLDGFNDNGPTLAFDGEVAGLLIAGRTVAHAAVEGAWTEGVLRVDFGRVRQGGVHVTLTDVEIDPDDPWWVTHIGTASVTAKDARAALVDAGLEDAAARLPSTPIAASVDVSRRRGEASVRATVEVETGESVVAGRGRIELPAAPDQWRGASTEFAATVAAQVADLVALGEAPVEATGPIGGQLRVAGPLGELRVDFDLDGADLEVDGKAVRRARTKAALTWPQLGITELEIDSDIADVDGAGRIDLSTWTVDGGRLEAACADLGALSKWFPDAPELAGGVRLSTTVDGPLLPEDRGGSATWTGLTGEVEITGEDVRIGDVTLGQVELSGRAADEVLTIARVHGNGPLAEFEAKGTFGLSSRDLHVAFLVAAIPEVSALSRWLPETPTLAGPLNVAGWVRKPGAEAWRDVEGKIELFSERLTVGDTELREASLFARGGRGAFDVYRARATTPLGKVDGEGTVRLVGEAIAGVVDRLEANLAEGDAQLLRPAPFAWSEGVLALPDIAARGRRGQVEGRISLGPTVDVDLSVSDVSLGHFDDALAGRASARLVAAGPAEAPTIRIEARVPDMAWRGNSAPLHVVARQDAAGWHVERCSVQAEDLLALDVRAELPLRFGSDGITRLPGGEPDLEIVARSQDPAPWLNLLVPGRLAAKEIAFRVRTRDGRLTADLTTRDLDFAGTLGGLPGFPGVTSVKLRDDGTATRLDIQRETEGTVDFEGWAQTAPIGDWLDPVAVVERLRPAALEGALTFDTRELAAFAAGITGVAYLAGHARGQVTVAGTVEAPVMTGSLEAEDLSVRLEGQLPAIDRGRLRATWRGETFAIEAFEGRLGYGPIRAHGRAVFGDREWPDVQVEVEGENALLARSADLRLRANLSLRLSGPLDALGISGKIDVTDALYSKRFEYVGTSRGSGRPLEIPGIRSGLLSNAHFDLLVRADETLRVDNNLFQGALSADLQIRGRGIAPRPEGRVTVRNGKLTLPLSTLRVEQASAAFAPETDLDARLQATAFTRMQGYDLTVNATGTLSEPRFDVSSMPPLTQEEAILFLTTGTPPADDAAGGTSRAALGKAAGLIGAEILEWIADSDPDEETILDDATLEIGREQSDDFWSTIELEVPFAPGWFLRAERDRYGDYNAGVMRRFWLR